MKKILVSMFIIVFCGAMLIPFIFANREINTISKEENRYLSNPPTAMFGTQEYKIQLEDWLDDNMACRKQFLDMRSLALYKFFNTVSSDKVEKGKDNWLFYTLDNNLELVKGGYPLDEHLLQEIAEIQQEISDYYKQMGKKYILVLTPSKVSIYPEKLYGDFFVGQTPCDILYEYLCEHTNVRVVNTKDYLVDAKDDGQVYWKTDTHWTSFGAYYAYEAIIDVLHDVGVINSMPIDVKKTTETVQGNLMDMIGCGNYVNETADAINFTMSSEEIFSGTEYDMISKLCHQYGDKIQGLHVYENDNSTDKLKLLIYGNSQFCHPDNYHNC